METHWSGAKFDSPTLWSECYRNNTCLDDLANWNYTLDPSTITGYNLIVTTDLCIYLDAGNNFNNMSQNLLHHDCSFPNIAPVQYPFKK